MKKSLFTAFAVGLCITANLMAQVPSYVPTNGLVGWWPFNGNAQDESGNGNNGTVNGATLTADRFGNANKAYSFNGLDDYLQIMNSPSLDFTNGTINLWFNTINQNISTLICKNSFQDATNESWHIYINENSAGTTNFATKHNSFCSPGLGWEINSSSSFNIFSNSNMLTALVKTDTTFIFLNGNLINSFPVSNQIDNCLGDIQIARHWADDPRYYSGIIDDIGIWNRALTPQEISDLYNSTNCANDLTISPSINTIQTGGTANFTATTSNANSTFTWQSDFGQGFQTLNDFGNYSGTSSNNLSISNVQFANHNQPIRAISSNTNCTDTSNVATIQIADTCITTVYDTLLTTVTDTLVINTTLGLPAPNSENTILIYPNPASDHITIDNGNYAAMSGYTIKIQNNAGQQVFQSAINQQQFYVDLSTWSGNGLYFVHLIDPQNNTVTVRKIVLQ
jgi:hypothetical protein